MDGWMDDLLLSRLRNISRWRPLKAFDDIFLMPFEERSSTFRAVRYLKAFDGSADSALKGRSSSDRFFMPTNMSAFRTPIWFSPSLRKRRFRRPCRRRTVEDVVLEFFGHGLYDFLSFTLNPLDGRLVMWFLSRLSSSKCLAPTKACSWMDLMAFFSRMRLSSFGNDRRARGSISVISL